MTNFARSAAALLCGLMSVTPACAWSEARPTLVLQLSRVARTRATPEAATRAQEFVFSAAVSMALEQAAFESTRSPRIPPMAAATFPYADVGPPNATDAASPEASTDSSAPPQPYVASSFDSAGFDCERSPSLCAWARTSEEAAFIALLEMPEVEL
jgi:hypothetical protein